MQKTRLKKMLSLILCIVLIAVMALFTTGCSDKNQNEEGSVALPEGTEQTVDSYVLGEGETEFTFSVTDVEGKETIFTIRTDKTIVGEALLDLELIAGDAGEYGLYVKTVNGITLDYDTDGKYWAFYVDGEYAVSGVDTTEIVVGTSYSFKAE